ncbi:ComEA family DNA-binding protein [Halomonas sp. FL8]
MGAAKAQAIVEDRTANGPFASVDELDRVSGVDVNGRRGVLSHGQRGAA